MEVLIDAVYVEVDGRRVCDQSEKGEQEPGLAHGAQHVGRVYVLYVYVCVC